MPINPMEFLRMQNMFGPTNMGNNMPGQNPGLTVPDMYPGAAPNPMGNISIAPPSAPAGAPSAIQPNPSPDTDIISKIFNSYTPETQATDRFNSLVDKYPQREAPENQPSMLRKIGGALAAIGPQFEHGHFKYNPQAQAAGEAFVDKPFTDKLQDWKNQIQPSYEAANLERFGNVNNRTLAYQTAASELREQAQRHREANDAVKADQAEQKAKLMDLKARRFEFDTKGPTIIALDPISGKPTDTKFPTGLLSEIEKIHLNQSDRMAQIGAQGQNAKDVANINVAGRQNTTEDQGWTLGYDQETGKSVWYNPRTQEMKPVDRNIRPFSKSGSGNATDFTAATKTMMEGAQMILPHIKELRQQAADLEKRGLFGPIMSRIRDMAAKVGTTGDPAEVEANMNKFANDLVSDPTLRTSNDAMVGQFLTTLGLMSSGAGRVHGGARGGGSIQMINYMKSLLSSSSTLDMFNGRMNGLESYMKGYAQGPKPATVPATDLDKAIADIFAKKEPNMSPKP